VIHTPRIILRAFRAGDVDDVFEYARDPEWARYATAVPESYTRSDAEQFVASQASPDWTLHPSWAIEVEGRAVGGVNFRFRHEQRIAGLGYGVARRLWGRGLAVEAARAAIDAAFRACPRLERVRAKADARNAPSIRVMEKLGMRREGLLRRDRLSRGELVDEVVYGLLRHEWKSPQPS
jgi:ribosomal-protein-alanine N-acetyltransferase